MVLLVALLATPCVAAWAAEPNANDASYLQATPKQMRWWLESRFGMFVHWGPISVIGKEISWSRAKYAVPGPPDLWVNPVPVEEYDNLYKRFNPTKFNADEWVRTVKAAGMKYIVFTTKHHDGFCEFDSKLTDYDIMSTPYGRDIVAQLAKACHKHGLKLGFYYSVWDYYNPDYSDPDPTRYIDYMYGQLRELLSNYGKVDIMWFDATFLRPKQIDTSKLFRMIRELQPGILINDRVGLPGDFGTPEQAVGSFNNSRPWESCITLCHHWAWEPNDDMKSLKQVIDTLVGCASGDGNLLLNVGPMPDGRIEPRQVERLKEVGAWLKKYGESIYGTRGGPFMPTKNIASTYKGNTIYVHILSWPGAGDTVELPAIGKRIVSGKLLTGGKVTVKQTADGISLSVSPECRRDLDTIVALKLDGPASEIAPIAQPTPTEN